MRKTLAILLLLVFTAVMCGGCVLTDHKAKPEKEEEPPKVVEMDKGITVSGSVVRADGKEVDLKTKNSCLDQVKSCQWLEDKRVLIECTQKGHGVQEKYLAVYDFAGEAYVYEKYGQQFIWKNKDLDTLVYIVDYSDDDEPSQVLDGNDVLLYESGINEKIHSISYVPKGIKVEVGDEKGENVRDIVVEASI